MDVAHGLFAGIRRNSSRSARPWRNANDWVLSGLLLGFACGTKYTGLETAGILLLILAFLALRKRIEGGWKPLALVAGLALLVGGPWYVKNIVSTGNPVYPFLFERFGGVDWDQKRADIYRDEQMSFGVGVSAEHKDWSQLGHAVFGLAYQPGRYVNPQQTVGGGNPLGAVGIAIFAGLLFWALARRPDPLEGGLLAFVGVSLVLWFALSQQSRYATTLAIPACLLLGGAAVSGAIGRIAAAAAVLKPVTRSGFSKQAAWTQRFRLPWARLPRWITSMQTFRSLKQPRRSMLFPPNSKVALYDQVFGYYLDRSYFWANPGHSTLIPYDSIRSGKEYADAMRKLGFTHIYIQLVDRETDPRLLPHLAPGRSTCSCRCRSKSRRWRGDWKSAWKVHFTEAVALGEVTL